ncbi:MAG TPA: hypothetical protein VL172_15840, partial [Kofleriaceae bacterium]|nr:hypothetical protein [Kofleriaceae bacterium]
CTGLVWELMSIETYRIWSLFYLGELEAMSAAIQRMLEDARQHGDLYTRANLSTGLCSNAWLADGDVDGCERAVDDAMQRWSARGYHLQRYWEMFARVQCELYRGDGAAAHRRIEDGWPGFRGSLLTHIELVRAEAEHLRARALLAAAAEQGDPGLVRSAAALAGRLDRPGRPWTDALAALVRAGASAAAGDRAAAADGFAAAEQACTAAGLAAHAAAARHRRGELAGGDTGAAACTDAAAWLAGRGVRDPARFAAMLAPGLPPDRP